MSGPMDPEALDSLRRFAAAMSDCEPGSGLAGEISRVIDAHDWQAKRADVAEAKLEVALTGGLRGLLDDAEAERDRLRAALADDSAKHMRARHCAENYRARLIERDGEGIWPALPWNE